MKKIDDVSTLESFDHNPIRTSYELLWSEVRNENRSNLTIQNTLRRILENYFKILGNMDKDKIIERFDGREKVICASLFSWVNDGSHNALPRWMPILGSSGASSRKPGTRSTIT